MRNWNVVVTIYEHQFARAISVLEEYGWVHRTGLYNVLVMEVENPRDFLSWISRRVAVEPELFDVIARVMPVDVCFDFSSADDFAQKARAAAMAWLPELAGKSFHVRMHRRGLKGVIERTREEQRLDGALLEAMAERGQPGSIDFDRPEAVVVIETVRDRAGMALWTWAELEHYPLLARAVGVRIPAPAVAASETAPPSS